MKLPIDATLIMPQRTVAAPARTVAAPARTGTASDDEALRQTCETFEAIFAQQMFKAMRSTIGDGGLLQKTQADEIYAGLMDQQVAQDLAGTGSLGISEKLFAQLREKA
jgi:flagellar protein FlgJ